MNMKPWAIYSVVILVSSGASSITDWTATEGTQRPAWLVDRPLPAPIVFGEGSISTPDDEMDARSPRTAEHCISRRIISLSVWA